jgi:hypothetical protein
MSCGKHHGRHENCVCEAVEKILAEQEAVEEQCPTGRTLLEKTQFRFLCTIKKADCSPHLETSEDLWMICNASNPFSSELKNYATAVRHSLFYGLSM